MVDDVEKLLEERGDKYGAFMGHARVTQELMDLCTTSLRNNLNFTDLERADEAVLLEALHMIMHKVGRIVNGDPMYKDSWDDVAGYARLVSKHIENTPPF